MVPTEHVPQFLACSIPIISITRSASGTPRALYALARLSVASCKIFANDAIQQTLREFLTRTETETRSPLSNRPVEDRFKLKAKVSRM